MKINRQKNFDDTLNLPKDTIPSDAKLVKKQGYFLESLQDPKKYRDAQQKNANSKYLYNISQIPLDIKQRINPKDIVNEIFKDVLIRYECMQGNSTFHKIGFIYENTLQDEEEISKNGDVKNRVAFQKKLYDTVSDKIHRIRTLGTVVDYSKDNYSTISNEFSNKVIDKFYKMYNNGKIYFDEKPMHYCSNCGKYYDKTGVKYIKKKHINLYTMYRVKDDRGVLSKYNNLRNTYVIATTINPWMVAVSDELVIEKNTTYSIVEVEQISSTQHYIIKKDNVSQVMQNAFFTKYIIKDEITSKDLEQFLLINPMDYTQCIQIISEDEIYVSPDKKNSTGIRVIVPEYSYLDYLIYKKQKKELKGAVINENGVILRGNVRVVGKKINSVNEFIISYLRKGEFIFLGDYIALSLPVCEKCNVDTIYISKPAFYIKSNLKEAEEIKEKAIELLEKSTFTKKGFKEYVKRKILRLDTNQDVIISDYSMLGTLVPIYKCLGCNTYYINDDTVTLTKEFIKNKGITQLNVASAQDILKSKNICAKCGKDMIAKCDIVFNIFFRKLCIDILERINTTKQKIDVLIQSRNDFVDRLKILMYDENGIEELNNIEKYILHSDVLEDTKIIAKPIFFDKNSKEDIANAIKTEIGILDVSKKYGTDILRLWGVLSARNKNIILNEQSIIKSNKIYKNLRRAIKFLLSNLQDFNPSIDYIEIENRTDLDKYMYIKLYDISSYVREEYEKCNFDVACKTLCSFVKEDLCIDYFNSIKYRLYILDKKDKIHLMTLSTLFDIFMQLVMYLEPIIPFTLEEAWQYAWHSSKEEEKNILMHRESITLSKLEKDDFSKKWNKIFKFARSTNKLINNAIAKKEVNNSQEVLLVLNVLEEKKAFLEENIENLEKTLNVSKVEVNVVDDSSKRGIVIKKAVGQKCARCRNITPDVGRDVRYVHICQNCVKILEHEN